MARDFIKIDTVASTQKYGGRLVQAKNTLREAYELLTELKAVMDHATDGSVWTDLEALFGAPAGQGQTVYNLVTGAVGAIAGTTQSADGKTLTERMG